MRRTTYTAVAALIVSLLTNVGHVNAKGGGHLGVDSTVGEILRHPAFAGFGRLPLPWDDRDYEEQMPLTRIASLLPYHSHVDPETVTNALNRMIDDAARGQTVFYSYYTETQQKQQPARKNTGLFFFRGTRGAPFAVIAPGGGFNYVGSVHEGFPYAEAISSKGYNALVLHYRAGYGGTVATKNLAAAVSYIFHNGATLGVGTSGYSLWGSSAGARMAAAIGSHGAARFGRSDVPSPAAVVMAYTAHSDYTAAEPARLLWWASRAALPRRPRWKRELQPCASPARRWSIGSTRISVTDSASAQARLPRDGCLRPQNFGGQR